MLQQPASVKRHDVLRVELQGGVHRLLHVRDTPDSLHHQGTQGPYIGFARIQFDGLVGMPLDHFVPVRQFVRFQVVDPRRHGIAVSDHRVCQPVVGIQFQHLVQFHQVS